MTTNSASWMPSWPTSRACFEGVQTAANARADAWGDKRASGAYLRHMAVSRLGYGKSALVSLANLVMNAVGTFFKGAVHHTAGRLSPKCQLDYVPNRNALFGEDIPCLLSSGKGAVYPYIPKTETDHFMYWLGRGIANVVTLGYAYRAKTA